jgi:hypothetical protein
MPRFIPTDEIRNLTRGSYEHLISQLGKAVQTQCESLFGSECQTHLLGTFNGYAMVASSEGQCRRIKYESSTGGDIRFVKIEIVEVPSYEEEDLGEFLEDEASRVIALFNKGSLSEATDKLRGLASVAGSWQKGPQEADLVETWVNSLTQERPWQRLYEAKKDRIHRSVWEGLRAVEDDLLHPKFRKLYDGTISQDDLEGYRDLVVDDFTPVQLRINLLAEKVQEAYAVIRSTVNESESVSTFTSFSEDLLEDFARISTIAMESPTQVRRVDQLGRLHDKLVERISTMEIASLFVSQMADRFRETH